MSDTWPDLSRKLQAPFPAEDIEFRVGRSGLKDGKPWAQLFTYITARAVHARLDEVVGPGNWKVEYQPITVNNKPGFLAGISIKFGEEWVTKWDGAEVTDIEALKGGLSDATKRAASVWGIGRYLYALGVMWADFSSGQGTPVVIKDENEKKHYFRWKEPKLPPSALP